MNSAVDGVTVSLNELVRLQGLARHLKLADSGKTISLRAGPHLSRQQGRGLEFDEVRLYQAGDDIRSIDWRVTARRGRPHTKLYREERERPVFIFVDLQPTMFFGTRRQFKSVLACRLAALMAWTASFEGDRVGGVVASQEKCSVLPPRSRRAGVLTLLNKLVSQQPTKPDDIPKNRLDEWLGRLNQINQPGSTIIVLSDFSGLGHEGKYLLARLSRKSRVTIVFIYDPLEADPPNKGRYRLGSPETQVRVDLSSMAARRSWRSDFAGRLGDLQELSRRTSMSLLEVSTKLEAHKVIQQGFNRGKRQ